MLFMMSGTPGKETKKLMALCVLFVLVLGAFWISVRRSQTAPSESKVSTELPVTVEDAEQPLPLGSMRVQAVPDADAANGAPVQDKTGIPAPSGKITDREGMIEEDYLFDIIKAAKRIPAAELRSRARRIPFGDFFHNPEDWRGKVMRIEGRIQRLVQRRGKKLPDGIETLYEAQILAPSGFWYWVFIVEKPRFWTGDLVAFNGIFMKVHAYENRRGGTIHAPLFVCKNFERFEIEPSPFFGAVGWATFVIVIVGLVLAVIVIRTQKRSSEAIAHAVEGKRLDKARQWAKSRKEGDKEGDAEDES